MEVGTHGVSKLTDHGYFFIKSQRLVGCLKGYGRTDWFKKAIQDTDELLCFWSLFICKSSSETRYLKKKWLNGVDAESIAFKELMGFLVGAVWAGVYAWSAYRQTPEGR